MTAGVDASTAVRVTGVNKRFVANRVLKDVGLDIATGQVHALVGGNGSGKSTLIKILAGVHTADSGRLETPDGSIDLSATSPALAEGAGFRFVHQAQSTFPDLSVAENLCIGRGFETGVAGIIRERRVRRRVEEVLQRFHIDADPGTPMRALGPAAQAMMAIARALQDEGETRSRVLVLDEPTAALPPAEVDILLTALRRYAQAGTAVVFVSHRLDEVLAVADVVTALRDGRRVATVPRQELTHDGLVELIAGRPMVRHGSVTSKAGSDRPVLRASGLRGGTVRDISLAVDEGEIVGLCGLAGSGTSTVLRLLFGAQPLEGGTVTLDGRELKRGSTSAAIDAGMAFVPADRPAYGIFDSLTIGENITAGSMRSYWRRGRLRGREERRSIQAAIDHFLVKAQSPDQPIGQLSGGNQQKVVVARSLSRPGRRLVLLDEPTQGIDTVAWEEVWSIVRRAAQDGAGVIVASSALEELAEVCDRVVIVRRGRIVDELAEPITVDRLINSIHRKEVV